VKAQKMTNKKHRKKLKRAAKKKKDKAQAQQQQEQLKNQMNMFDRLPETCSTCNEEFPKTREAHMTWRVVVRNEKQQVRLFCPECQDKAKKAVENSNEV
jgi:hypothetical protein